MIDMLGIMGLNFIVLIPMMLICMALVEIVKGEDDEERIFGRKNDRN